MDGFWPTIKIAPWLQRKSSPSYRYLLIPKLVHCYYAEHPIKAQEIRTGNGEMVIYEEMQKEKKHAEFTSIKTYHKLFAIKSHKQSTHKNKDWTYSRWNLSLKIDTAQKQKDSYWQQETQPIIFAKI